MAMNHGRLLLTRCRCCSGSVSTQAKQCPHCGQPEPGSLPTWEREARELLRQVRKIDAIRAVRDGTGLDLKAAKDLVESWGSK